MQLVVERYLRVPSEPVRSGGMAEVIRAVDITNPSLNVAVKFFDSSALGDRYVREAYTRECDCLKLLDHPNIVRILDGGNDPVSGRKFVVLEWMECSLLDHIREHPLAGWDEFYERYGRPLLEALAYAFGKGVSHRDIKPANVLVSCDGVPKLADFGIAKYRPAGSPSVSLGLTMADFRSVPYSPPEEQGVGASPTRDVFSFAVLVLQCLSEETIDTYEKIYLAVEECDLPPPIIAILESALAKDPARRPGNVLALKERLAEQQADRERGWTARHICHIKAQSPTLQFVRGRTKAGTSPASSIVKDLTEYCGISVPDDASPSNPEYMLAGSRFLYRAVPAHPESDHLIVVRASEPLPHQLEQVRESFWHPAIEFRYGRPAAGTDGKGDLDRLLLGCVEHLATAKQSRLELEHDRVFRSWGAILNAKENLENGREHPLPYVACEWRGARLFLEMEYAPPPSVIGQHRVIERDGRVVLAGEIDRVTSDGVFLWIPRPPRDEVPKRGRLLFDTRANRIALHRQRNALDAVRFRRSIRTDLSELLVDPSRAASPEEQPPTTFFQSPLDDDKQRAVGLALGSKDVLVVEGPPGTGKTKFITEVILQVLERSPSARILLTSQTHVALDNALERVRDLRSNVRAIRIGRVDDERVAVSVRELLIENKVQDWLKRSHNRTEAFLTEYASQLGVDRADIRLGMDVGRLRAAAVEERRCTEALAEARSRLTQFGEADAARESRGVGDTYHELQERIRQASEDVSALEAELQRMEAGRFQAAKSLQEAHPWAKELTTASVDELLEWEKSFLESSEDARRLHQLIRLAEEWQLRFSQSQDFYGAVLAESQLVAGTCLGFASAPGMHSVAFDLCILDEASKATVTEALVPMARANSWILVGDRNQLPPFVEDALDDVDTLKDLGLARDDLRDTLLHRFTDGLPKSCVTRLRYQHRMTVAIGDLVSDCFYDGELITPDTTSPPSYAPAIPMPVTWFTTSHLNNREVRVGRSFSNPLEIAVIRQLVERINFILSGRAGQAKIAIIAGYAAQVAELERAVAQIERQLLNVAVEVNTVDAFQGREADIAIYSVTRSNHDGDLGFLRERRRLNVALSRGRQALVIVGDHHFCRSSRISENPFIKVISHIERHRQCALAEVSI